MSGSRVNFEADDGDSPFVKPFWIDEDGTIVREKRKLYFVSDNGELKISLDEPDISNNFKLIKE